MFLHVAFPAQVVAAAPGKCRPLVPMPRQVNYVPQHWRPFLAWFCALLVTAGYPALHGVDGFSGPNHHLSDAFALYEQHVMPFDMQSGGAMHDVSMSQVVDFFLSCEWACLGLFDVAALRDKLPNQVLETMLVPCRFRGT